MQLNTFNLVGEEVDLLKIIEKQIVKKRDVELCNSNLLYFESILNSCHFLKNYNHWYLTNSFKLKNNKQNAHILHVKTISLYNSPKSGEHAIVDNYLFGYFEAEKALGHVFVRPETIEDKINEFFTKTEIDFESNPKFSKKYFMLSDNRELTENNVNHKFLSVIEDHNGLHIEIKNNKIITTSLTNMNIDEVDRITDFCKRASMVI